MNPIVSKALSVTEGDRFEHYGDPRINHARTGVLWDALDEARFMGGSDLTPALVVCLRNILQKIARLVETPDHEDSYTDIIGYALNAAKIMDVGETKAGSVSTDVDGHKYVVDGTHEEDWRGVPRGSLSDEHDGGVQMEAGEIGIPDVEWTQQVPDLVECDTCGEQMLASDEHDCGFPSGDQWHGTKGAVEPVYTNSGIDPNDLTSCGICPDPTTGECCEGAPF